MANAGAAYAKNSFYFNTHCQMQGDNIYTNYKITKGSSKPSSEKNYNPRQIEIKTNEIFTI